jgi:hypothetical protein
MLVAMLGAQCLTLLLPTSQQQKQHLVTRRCVLHGTVASFAMPAAVHAADVSLGSNGISSYEKLKLDTANGELAEAIIASKSSALKSSLEAYAAALNAIANSQATKDTASRLNAASLLLVESSASESKFADQIATIEKQSRSTAAACAKADVGAAALAGTKLGDALTDLAFGWTATVRPLQEITIGQPDLLSKDGYKESFSGLGTRKGGML